MSSVKGLQQKASLLYNTPGASVSDYVKEWEQITKHSPASYMRKTRVAFLSSFTIQGLPEVFVIRALFHNIWAETYLGLYNQFTQEVLNEKSELHKFRPDIIFILIDSVDVVDEKHLETIIGKLAEQNIPIVISSFANAPVSDANNVVVLNDKLKELEQKLSSVFVFDLGRFLKDMGNGKHWYTKYVELGDFRIAPDAFPQLTERLLEYTIAQNGATKKCLVLDLDNTLWDGVVGEDGVFGIKPNRKLQEYIKKLKDKGVVLAINSKNNPEDASEVFYKNEEMILQENDFSAKAINWWGKAENMNALAKELNIGTDSFVFVDDSPFEQELIRKTYPEIAIVPIDEIENYAGFAGLGETQEDTRRADMYKEEEGRKRAQENFKNVEDYLSSLNMTITINDKVNDQTVPRTSQLTQKTNQFNVTTKRYTQEDIFDMHKNGFKILALSASDIFGDYGVIGIAIVEPKNNVWFIDTFLLSCRILGREVEKAFMGYIINEARKNDITALEGEFIPTAKNKPSASFFTEVGFVQIKQDKNRSIYSYDIQKKFTQPYFITISNQ